jgi:hypothetical protein
VTGEWLDHDDPATIVVVTGGRTAAEVVSAFGADPSRPLRGDELIDALYEGGIVLVHAAEDVAFVVEPNGWLGSEPPVLSRLSEPG